MISVWLLLITTANSPTFGPTVINVDGIVFETAERCLKNVPLIQDQLKGKSDYIRVECFERELHPKNKAGE